MFLIAVFVMIRSNMIYASILDTNITDTSIDEVLKDRSFNIRHEDQEFAKELGSRSKKMSIEFIKAKWDDLKKMQGFQDLHGDELDNIHGYDDFTNISLRVFVSSSMNKQLLKTYAQEARKYGATIVLNGLPEGSWQELASLIDELTDDGEYNIDAVIDDEAFRQFNVKTVPAFVLSKEDMFGSEGDFDKRDLVFDKITGNIGIKAALERFESQGDLSEIAKNYITQNYRDMR